MAKPVSPPPNKIALSAIILVVLIAGGMYYGYWYQEGYFWNPNSPCKLEPDQPYRGVIKPPLIFPLGIDLITNQGYVCFYPKQFEQGLVNELQVQVYSSGCYSSSCSMVYKRTGQLKINQDSYIITITSQFAVKSIDFRKGTVCECSEDCGGAGMLEFETGFLKDGIYKVMIGETFAGIFSIPFNANHLCLNSEQPMDFSNPYPPN